MFCVSDAGPVRAGRHVQDESGLARLPAARDRERRGDLPRVQGRHLVLRGHTVSTDTRRLVVSTDIRSSRVEFDLWSRGGGVHFCAHLPKKKAP